MTIQSKLKILTVLLLLLTSFLSYTLSQGTKGSAVDYFGNPVEYSTINGLGYSEEEQALQNFMQDKLRLVINTLDTQPDIAIQAARGISNLMAVPDDDGKPLIIYNPNFIKQVANGEADEWVLLNILAHEVGHHIDFHVQQLIVQKDSLTTAEKRALELEADGFSGKVLFELGASREEAQLAIQLFASEDSSSTHPDKESRLFTVASGWFFAKQTAPPPLEPKPETVTAPAVGKFSVQTEPSGVPVFIDGTYYGQTPIQASSLLTGQHNVRLAYPNFVAIEESFTVGSEDITELSYTLVSIEQSNPVETIQPTETETTVKTPVTEVDSESESEEQAAGIGFATEESKGLVTIESIPDGATFLIGEEIIGFTPMRNLELDAGQYELIISYEGYKEVKQHLIISEGETTQISERLLPLRVSSNRDWIPQFQLFSRTEMVLVPPGSFMMGSTEGEIDTAFRLCQESDKQGNRCRRGDSEDQAPRNRQVITDFYLLDKTEVTRIAYEECVSENICSRPEESEYSTSDKQPINKVTWNQAAQYCEWRGARLPTEAEWEYAAKGPDNLFFPWGNRINGNEANHNDESGKAKYAHWTWYMQKHNDGFADTAPVGSYPQGKSWVGALDMAGNVYEWTATESKPYPYNSTDDKMPSIRSNNNMVVRGGGFNNSAFGIHTTLRNRPKADTVSDGIGFRCASSNYSL